VTAPPAPSPGAFTPGANGPPGVTALEATALAPLTTPEAAGEPSIGLGEGVPTGATKNSCRPGPEVAGTIARNVIATIAVMNSPSTMPMAVWRWSGSIRLMGSS
jgi:hypothetical protein